MPAPARGRGSNWRRPDRDNWAVGLFGVLSLRHFGWSFIPCPGGTDKSGAAKFLLDLLGPPDGEVAAACRCRFFLAITIGGGDRVVE